MLNTFKYTNQKSRQFYEPEVQPQGITGLLTPFLNENTVNFNHYIQEKYLNQICLINDLCDDLEKDDLNMCYQPLVDLKTGAMTGVEALIRWQHKLKGLISPDIFIPLAEQTGHIHALTYWVLNHSLEQLHHWTARGINIDMAVNLSIFNVHEENFPLQVSRLMDKWSIQPRQLILEITEGVIMYEPDRAISILERLNQLGVRLALDDFGTGYSSLSYLSRLPIHELKIDRSLITDIDKNYKNAMIVRTTIDLAQKLGFKIVAEGVEDAVVCNILKEYGCDTAQGYYFSKPVSEIQFESLLARACPL